MQHQVGSKVQKTAPKNHFTDQLYIDIFSEHAKLGPGPGPHKAVTCKFSVDSLCLYQTIPRKILFFLNIEYPQSPQSSYTGIMRFRQVKNIQTIISIRFYKKREKEGEKTTQNEVTTCKHFLT